MVPLASREAAKRRIASVGPTMPGYFTWDPQGETRLTTGPTVEKPLGSSDEQLGNGSVDSGFAVRALGGVKCGTVVHTGPHDTLMPAYRALSEWIVAKGY